MHPLPVGFVAVLWLATACQGVNLLFDPSSGRDEPLCGEEGTSPPCRTLNYTAGPRANNYSTLTKVFVRFPNATLTAADGVCDLEISRTMEWHGFSELHAIVDGRDCDGGYFTFVNARWRVYDITFQNFHAPVFYTRFNSPEVVLKRVTLAHNWVTSVPATYPFPFVAVMAHSFFVWAALEQITFRNNSALDAIVGFHNSLGLYTFSSSIVEQNQGTLFRVFDIVGSVASNLELRFVQNVFTNNRADSGTVLRISKPKTATTFSEVTFTNNTASDAAAVALIASTEAQLTFTACVFVGSTVELSNATSTLVTVASTAPACAITLSDCSFNLTTRVLALPPLLFVEAENAVLTFTRARVHWQSPAVGQSTATFPVFMSVGGAARITMEQCTLTQVHADAFEVNNLDASVTFLDSDIIVLAPTGTFGREPFRASLGQLSFRSTRVSFFTNHAWARLFTLVFTDTGVVDFRNSTFSYHLLEELPYSSAMAPATPPPPIAVPYSTVFDKAISSAVFRQSWVLGTHLRVADLTALLAGVAFYQLNFGGVAVPMTVEMGSSLASLGAGNNTRSVQTYLFVGGRFVSTNRCTVDESTGQVLCLAPQARVSLACPAGFEHGSVGSLPSTLSCQRCTLGRYQLAGDVQSNSVCQTCPRGARCEGHSVLAESGFWLEQIQGVAEPNRVSAVACRFGWCLGVDVPVDHVDRFALAADNNYMPASKCDTNRQGVMCGECVPGSSPWGNDCLPNDGVRWDAICLVLGAACVYVLATHILAQKSKGSGLTRSMVFFLQSSSLIASPQLARVLSLFAYDVDGIQGTALFPRSHLSLFWMKLFIPVLLAVLLVILALILYYVSLFSSQYLVPNHTRSKRNAAADHKTTGVELVQRRRASLQAQVNGRTFSSSTKDVSSPTTTGSTSTSMSTSGSTEHDPSISGPRRRRQRKPRKSYFDVWMEFWTLPAVLRSWINLSFFSYQLVTDTSLAFMNCVSVAGVRVVASQPAVRCNTGTYKVLLGVVFVPALILVGIVWPVVLFLKLRSLARSGLMQDPAVVRVWGTTYETYVQQYYWWDTVLLGRRFLLVSLAVGLSSTDLGDANRTRPLCLALACLIFLLHHFAAYPHVTAMHNYFTTLVLSALVALGVVESSVFALQSPSTATSLSLLFILLPAGVYVVLMSTSIGQRSFQYISESRFMTGRQSVSMSYSMDRSIYDHRFTADRRPTVAREGSQVGRRPPRTYAASPPPVGAAAGFTGVSGLQAVPEQAASNSTDEDDDAAKDDLGNTPPLPPGWDRFVDDHTGLPYYYHAASQQTTWTAP